MLEKLLGLPGVAEELPFIEDGCPKNQLSLQPYQQAQASLSTGLRGFGAVDGRRIRWKLGGDGAGGAFWSVRRYRGLNSARMCHVQTSFGACIWNNVRDLRGVHGVLQEAMANIAPERWRDRDFPEQDASGPQLRKC